MHTTDGSTVTKHVISQIRHLSKLFAKKGKQRYQQSRHASNTSLRMSLHKGFI